MLRITERLSPPTKVRFTQFLHPARGLRRVVMVEQQPLPMDELHNFIDGFEMLQYEYMTKAMSLPLKALGTTACVGPLFWWDLVETKIIFRKTDVRKRGSTRGWQLFLSHDIEENTTTGFYKGTESSNMTEVLSVFKNCADDAYHPLLLPLIIFEIECMSHTELKQRDVRNWVRRIEYQISLKFENPADDSYHLAALQTEQLRRDMVECQAQALWKAPKDYIRVLQTFRACLGRMDSEIHTGLPNTKNVAETHRKFASRVNLLEKRFENQSTYVETTLMRLSMQRDALDNLIARQENRLTVKLAGEQRALAYASKRDSTAMKALSLIGAIFLPGAYVASIMSTTFFDFHDSATLSSAVSPRFWLYWVVVMPLTACVVAVWFLWERQRKRTTHEVAEALKQQGVNVDQMEAEVLAAMQERRNSREERYV
ncbi:hypothetical protein J7T55_000258 [Diaporthe amygdali]|uniref:uncharacterized protein n=1 Tax=Phomopsis amygdali TaxID=1214568 RepID=UPI0022FDC9C7|nr:uncharacterized protein J7T55_000258 [Diaporthe amygdali]KAJ0109333.1 hypothetical protein J7T55_000258 [Diaporthe amygdali]